MDDGKSYVLSVALAIGDVLLMSNYDDICPKVIHTSLAGQLLLVHRDTVTECLTSDIFSMLLCGVSDCIIVFSIVLAP